MVEVLTDSPMWDECMHGLPAGTCSSCKHPLTAPAAPTVEHTFIARRDGHCPGCNLPISEGDHIAKMSDETYRHRWCA